MNQKTPQYDFNHEIFRQNLKYRRWAREHLQLAELQSDVIRWEVVQTVSPLNIPVVYHIHYHIKSIVGIKEDLHPVYADHHILELSIPAQYPLEGCKLAMLTDVWHPNIKSDGKFKGRVCSNTGSFGTHFDLYQLVLRVGEILQYKNYLAEQIPPFPEDLNVAKWILEFAEPAGIVDKSKEIAVDDTPLLRVPVATDEPAATPPQSVRFGMRPAPSPEPASRPASPPPQPEPEKTTTAAPPPPAHEIEEPPKIKIGEIRQSTEQKQKMTIRPKD